jgi:hypothetical protein
VEPLARPSFALRLAFLVALIFTLIGVVESCFIAFDLVTRSLSPYRAPDLSFGIRSWTLHHELRPGYVSPAVRTNSFGLRSPEVEVPKPAGTVRILMLGDSFTFGFRAPDDEVFARRLEVRLRKQFPAAAIEVVNAGVISYCPLLEYLQYRHRLHALEPDLVVLNFDMSDVQDHLAYSRDGVFDANGVPLFVTEPSLRSQKATAIPSLLSFEWLARRIKGARGRMQSTLEGVPFVRDQDRYLWTLDGGPSMDVEADKTMAPVGQLAKLLEHDGIGFVLATYPQPWQVSADATPLPPIRDQYGIGRGTVHLNDRPFRKLERFAAEHQIRYVSGVSAFRDAQDSAGLFLQNDFHFSRRGNDLYAQVLADFVVQQHLVTP